MFAPCGMNCKVCYKHCYNKKPCSGCLNSDKGKPEHCRKCKIKDCIKGKSLSYCFECAEYPCKLIKNLEKSYNKRYQASLIENSRFVQGHGLEHFMEQQKIKYTCPKCGGIILFTIKNVANVKKNEITKFSLTIYIHTHKAVSLRITVFSYPERSN